MTAVPSTAEEAGAGNGKCPASGSASGDGTMLGSAVGLVAEPSRRRPDQCREVSLQPDVAGNRHAAALQVIRQLLPSLNERLLRGRARNELPDHRAELVYPLEVIRRDRLVADGPAQCAGDREEWSLHRDCPILSGWRPPAAGRFHQ